MADQSDKICYFFDKMPGELRNRVYDMVYTITSDLDKSTPVYLCKDEPPSKELLLTSKTANSEARLIYKDAYRRFFRNSNFVIECQDRPMADSIILLKNRDLENMTRFKIFRRLQWGGTQLRPHPNLIEMCDFRGGWHVYTPNMPTSDLYLNFQDGGGYDWHRTSQAMQAALNRPVATWDFHSQICKLLDWCPKWKEETGDEANPLGDADESDRSDDSDVEDLTEEANPRNTRRLRSEGVISYGRQGRRPRTRVRQER